MSLTMACIAVLAIALRTSCSSVCSMLPLTLLGDVGQVYPSRFCYSNQLSNRLPSYDGLFAGNSLSSVVDMQQCSSCSPSSVHCGTGRL